MGNRIAKFKKKKKLYTKKMLMNALKAMVNNSFKESFYGKRKKKQLIYT